MRKTLLLILTVILLLSVGCIKEEQEVMAGLRPDKFWEGSWIIEERESRLEYTDADVTMEASCLVKYSGEKPAEDVRIIIKSPLTQKLIADDLAKEFGTVQPAEGVEYRLSHKCTSWKEKVSPGMHGGQLVEDFSLNSFVEITWKYGEDEYSVAFYDWGSVHPYTIKPNETVLP
ncbi:MAG: hypothetical protein GX996_02610 [Firmicutes bacterium]|nr:hypothetical protein [Bacillota bacterium]